MEGSLSVQEIYEQAGKLHLDLSADGYNFVVFTVQDAQRTAYTASAAVVLEEIAFINFHAFQLNPAQTRMQQELLDKHYLRKHGANAYYGQT